METWESPVIVTTLGSIIVAIITGIFGVVVGQLNAKRQAEQHEAEREDRRIDQILEATENHRLWADGSFKRMQARIESLEGEVSDARGTARRLEEANVQLQGWVELFATYIRSIIATVEQVAPQVKLPQPPKEIRHLVRMRD